MKTTFLLSFFFTFTLAIAQKEIIVYDAAAKRISSDSLFLFDFKKYRVWGEDTKTATIFRIYKIQQNKIHIDYKETVKQLKRLRVKFINETEPIVLKYDFFQDICPDSRYDEAGLSKMRDLMLNRVKDHNESVNYIHLFQKGVRVQFKREFVAMDNFEYFRKNIFNQPSLCGAMAIIYPDNTYKIHYGERAAFDLENN